MAEPEIQEERGYAVGLPVWVTIKERDDGYFVDVVVDTSELAISVRKYDSDDTESSEARLHADAAVLEKFHEGFAVEHTDAWIPKPDDKATCKHCDRDIVKDLEGRWIDPEAGYDDEDGDGVWRETCDRNESFFAEHEPIEEKP